MGRTTAQKMIEQTASRAEGLYSVDPEKLYIIRDPKHPLYDKREKIPVSEGLRDQLIESGVHEPILVVLHSELPDEYKVHGLKAKDLIVVDGIQRVQNLIEANKILKGKRRASHKIKFIVKSFDDVRGLFLTKVEANFHQQESLLGRAIKARVLMETFNYTREHVARAFGLKASSAPQVSDWVELAKAHKDIHRAVEQGPENGGISATAAIQLAKLPFNEQTTYLAKLLGSDKKPTAKRAKAIKEAGKKGLKKGGETTTIVSVGKRLQRKIFKEWGDKQAHCELDDYNQGFIDAIGVLLGDLALEDVRDSLSRDIYRAFESGTLHEVASEAGQEASHA
jgi:ParB family chromosome partitioning protein